MTGKTTMETTPSADYPKGPRKSKKSKTSFLLPFRDANALDMLLLVIGFFSSAGAGVLLPYFFRSVGDTINSLNTTMDVDDTVKKMAIFGILCLVLQALACFSMEFVADRLTAHIRCKYVASVLNQSMEWYDTNDSAALSSRLDVCLTDVRDGLGMKFVGIPCNVAMIIGAIVIAFTTSWSISLCALAGFIPSMIFACLLGWAVRTTGVKVNKALEEAGAVATETFTSIRTVVAFGGEKSANERYKVLVTKAEKEGIWGGLISGCGIGGLIMTVFALFTLVFYLSGRKAADSMQELLDGLPPGGEVFEGPPTEWPRPDFQAGSAFVISMCMLISAFSLGNMIENLSLFLKAVQAAADLYKTIDEPSKINPTSEEGEKDVPLDGDLVFDSVTFSYPSRPDAVVFKNFSLRIPAGKSVAFVGPSGCGKSTLLQLTQRVYDPLQGTVSISGKNLKSLNTRWYRSRLGVVMQEPRLFSVSIEENIRLGSATPKTFAEVEAVAKQAHVAAFVDHLPLRYNTMCGTGGAQLSGGQKQRVALARALLRKPAVLILDEATSALDAKSEKKVQEALDEVIRTSKSTTLIVAHRLTTIQGVDEIIVLDNRGNGAEVVQRGTHQELLQNTQGLYYHLFQSQSHAEANVDAKPVTKSPSSAISADAATTTGALACIDGMAEGAEGDDKVLMTGPPEGSPSVFDVLESAVGSKTPSLLAHLSSKTMRADKQNTARLTRAVKMLKPHWFVFTVMVVCSALSGISFPLFGLLLGHFLTVLFKPDVQELRDETNFWALLLLIYCLVRFPVELLKQYCKEYLGSRLSRMLRVQAFDNLVHQDVGFFDLPGNHTGGLVTILAGDVAVVTTAATGNFVSLFHAFFTVVGGVAIGFWNCWQLSLVLLATFLLSAAAVGLDHKLSKPGLNAAGGSRKKKNKDSASAIFAETVESIRVVMFFGLEKHFAELYEVAATSELGKKARNAIIFGISWGISQAMQFFVFSLALWFGSKLANQAKATPSEVLNTVFPLVFAATGLGIAVVYSTDAKKARRALVDVFRVIDRKSLIDVRDAGVRGAMLGDFTGAVDYSHVAFRYPSRPEQRVYKNLSFSIAPGESVALVGASGCGKSTAVQLLLRFYDLPTSKTIRTDGKENFENQQGEIRTDSTNIQDVNLKQLRSLIGLVSQEPILFNMTLGENIRYSKPDATQLEVEEAARMANAHGFISALPDGYNTLAGTAGAQLSGGQRQRIAIARALLRNPKILILDEATSALDAESEKQVQATLDRVVSGDTKRSTIIIAHRLSTVKSADKIVVLQNEFGEGSRVVEIGTHAALMNIPNGVYRGLVLSATDDE